MTEPPARDCLQTFQLEFEGDDIYVLIPEDVEGMRTPEMVEPDPDEDSRTFVILGCGAAGNMAAETLRTAGFKGRIIMISQEDRIPYDRPNLSKDYMQGSAEEEWMPLRSKDFYEKHGIELKLKTKVTGIDPDKKELLADLDEHVTYDRLLLATGGKALSLDVPGSDLENIFTLRSYDDSDEIIKSSENASNVVIIGASFIGMETAYSMAVRKVPVTIVAPEEVPFESKLGKELGELFRKQHESAGTKFILGRTVAGFEGDSKVNTVVLDNNERLDADLVIQGIGVRPNTDFLKDLGLESDGSLKVDEYFKFKEDIFAVGDIARFPYWLTDTHIRIEHWRTAEQQGRYAALNMLGKNDPFRSVPFFWTSQVGMQFRYVGHAHKWDDVIIDGNLERRKFILYYVLNNEVIAAAGVGLDKDMAAIEVLLQNNRMPSPNQLKEKSIDMVRYLKEH